MTSLKRLLSNGKALWLAAVVAVACSPSAAAVLAGDDRFVDEHASAMAADVATADTADLIAGIEDAAVAEGRSTQGTKASDAVEQPAATAAEDATVALNDATVEPAVTVITKHVV